MHPLILKILIRTIFTKLFAVKQQYFAGNDNKE